MGSIWAAVQVGAVQVAVVQVAAVQVAAIQVAVEAVGRVAVPPFQVPKKAPGRLKGTGLVAANEITLGLSWSKRQSSPYPSDP